MAQRDSISMQMVREALLQSGLSTAEVTPLLTSAGVDPSDWQQADGRVSARAYARLWRLLARRLDDEFFAMDPRPLRSGSLAFICRGAIAQPTVVQGLESMLAFLSLMLDRFCARLTRHQGLVEIAIHDVAAPPLRAFAYFTFWMIVHGVICWLAGRRVPILALDLRSAAPACCEDYRVMFSEHLRFAQPHTRMMFADDCLDLPIRRNQADLQRFLSRAPGNILVKYRDPDSFAQRIKAQLRAQVPALWPETDALAQQWHLSAATLRRRLADEEQTYQRLKDSVRKELAVAALADDQRSFADIAQSLGFADTSSFYKAFRKWFGANPGRYRQLIFGASGQTAQAD
jgi:AraC-like DNA-binding protein